MENLEKTLNLREKLDSITEIPKKGYIPGLDWKIQREVLDTKLFGEHKVLFPKTPTFLIDVENGEFIEGRCNSYDGKKAISIINFNITKDEIKNLNKYNNLIDFLKKSNPIKEDEIIYLYNVLLSEQGYYTIKYATHLPKKEILEKKFIKKDLVEKLKEIYYLRDKNVNVYNGINNLQEEKIIEYKLFSNNVVLFPNFLMFRVYKINGFIANYDSVISDEEVNESKGVEIKNIQLHVEKINEFENLLDLFDSLITYVNEKTVFYLHDIYIVDGDEQFINIGYAIFDPTKSIKNDNKKIAYTFTIDSKIYEKFKIKSNELAINKSKFIENKIKEFLDKLSK